METDTDPVVDAFEDLLERERRLLLAGSLDGLARIAAHKEELAARLKTVGRPSGLERLRAKAERNARLLDSAGAGIRSVLRRIESVREGPAPLSTYSASGHKTDLGGARRTMERRA